MFKARLDILFVSDWHVGSGLGDGSIADAALTRDVDGLLYLPGSALKGALREGAWRLGLHSRELALLPDFFFGTDSEKRITNRPGRIAVSQGDLDPALRAWLLEREDKKDFVADMTVIHWQTRLDSRKMVVPHSLRSVECGIPGLEFSASIAADAPADSHEWLREYLGAVCACVKSVGGDRSRGVGRCRLTLDGTRRDALPAPLPESLRTLIEAEENENS